jgi:hypothetical protein
MNSVRDATSIGGSSPAYHSGNGYWQFAAKASLVFLSLITAGLFAPIAYCLWPKTRSVSIIDPQDLDLPPAPVTLEQKYRNKVFTSIDQSDKSFEDYRVPNEREPIKELPHLQDILGSSEVQGHHGNGVVVTVGTERGWFLPCLDSRINKLIFCDITPGVVAYNHFNCLLLRLCNTAEEYRVLSAIPEVGFFTWSSRIKLLRKKINESAMDAPLKSFYLSHLEDFAQQYYDANNSSLNRNAWKDSESTFFTQVRYYQDEILYARLHGMATAGNVVVTRGDINDLSWIEGPIDFVDISNIGKYSFIQINRDAYVVHTSLHPLEYFHYWHEDLREEKIKQWGQAVIEFCKIHNITREQFSSHAGRLSSELGLQSGELAHARTLRVLECLQRYNLARVRQM